jgi:hypothetical protein
MRIFNRQPVPIEAHDLTFVNNTVPGTFARTQVSASATSTPFMSHERAFMVNGASYVCVRAGYYQFSGELLIGASGGGVLAGARAGGGIYLNGALIQDMRMPSQVKTTGDYCYAVGRPFVRYLKVGDTIGADAYHDDGSNRIGQVNITMLKVG